jgi:hypothetical protein
VCQSPTGFGTDVYRYINQQRVKGRKEQKKVEKPFFSQAFEF